MKTNEEAKKKLETTIKTNTESHKAQLKKLEDNLKTI